MKLTLPRADLHAALGKIGKIVPRRTTIPILSNLLLVAEGGQIRIEGTDLDISGRVTMPAGIAVEGRITVPAVALADIVGRMPDKVDVALELIDNPTRLVVRAGRARCTLPTLPAEDFPETDKPGELPHTATLPGTALAAALAGMSFAICDETARYHLNGVHLQRRDARYGEPGLLIEATDGHKLARNTLTLPDKAAFASLPAGGVIVPTETVQEIIRLAKAAETVTLATDGHRLRLTVGDVVMTSKLVDGMWPDTDRVVPVGNSRIAVIDREALAEATGRVAVVGDQKFQAMRMDFEAGELRLGMRNPGGETGTGGETEDAIDIDYDADALTIGFNARYVAEILGVLDVDRITIELEAANSPTVFRPTIETDPRLVVLMPLRV